MNAFIDGVLTPWLLFLAEWSVRWAILAALPIGMLFLHPPRSTRLRHDLCLVALVAGLALPLLPRWGGGFFGKVATAKPNTAVSTHGTDSAMPVDSPKGWADESPVDRDKVSVAIAPPASESSIDDVERLDPNSDGWIEGRRSAVFGLNVVWVVGVSVLLTRWLIGITYLGRLRHTVAPADPAAHELLSACCKDLASRRQVRLAVHHDITSPLTLGPWRPTILLPTSWRNLPQPLQRGSLLHELAHVKRRDDWLALALQAVGVAFFFHPCVRWLRSRLECEREMLCDEMALSCGVDARSYALMLRDFAGLPERLRPVIPALPFGQGPTVKRRIQRIMEENMTPSRSASRLVWCFGALLLVVSTAAGTWRLRAEAEQSAGQAAVPSDPHELPAFAPLDEKQAQAAKEKQQAQPLLPKEQFSYGGKCFEEWQALVRADLKPEVRIEAFQALSTFGKNGYADLAARAILEIAASYDPTVDDNSDRKVLSSASEEIRRLGPLAIPALQEELQRGKTNGRRFAALVLHEMYSGAKPANAALERALLDEDGFVRRNAAMALAHWSSKLSPPQLKALVGVVAAGLHANGAQEVNDALAALNALKNSGKANRGVVSDLAALFTKEGGIHANSTNIAFRFEIMSAMVQIGGDAKVMMPIYETILAEDQEKRWAILRVVGGDKVLELESKVLKNLSELGKEARSATPFLVAQYRARSKNLRPPIVDALMAIDADPKDLVPVIKDLLKHTMNPSGVLDEQHQKYQQYLKQHGVELSR